MKGEMKDLKQAPLPTATNERIEELDLIRGMALFGILVVNMAYFAFPLPYLNWTDQYTSPIDQFASGLITVFAEFKFVTMFSFLFGLGFMILMHRIEEKGLRPGKYFGRRAVFLTIIGLMHMILLWFGDILTYYGVLGLFLLLFYNRKPKTLLIWALVLFLLPVLSLGFLVLSMFAIPPEAVAEMKAEFQELGQQALLAYSNGTYTDILQQRLIDIGYMLQAGFLLYPIIFSMFLIGAYVWKTGMIQNINQHLHLIRKVWRITLISGVLISAMVVYFSGLADHMFSPYYYVQFLFVILGGPIICFFYVSSLLLVTRKKAWLRRLQPLQAVGRMALTQYLLQTVICTTIFYGYGFGLYGGVGPATGLILAIAIFVGQCILSHFWFKKFSSGPLEYVWRRWTYYPN